MATVRRFDRGDARMDDAVRTPEGFLRVPARITRTGVFVYRKYDGTERRELRLPDEVFNADALASFSLATLTHEHPPEPITARNVDKYRVGTAGENIRQDGEFVATTIVVQNADTVAAVERGLRELSCGYECELEEKAGTTPDGQRYDAIQRNIRGNHVALVTKGRAGPDARLRMDANDAEQVPDGAATHHNNKQQEQSMRKIKIDGVEYEVSESAAQAMEKALAAAAEATKAAKAELDKANARADKAAEDTKAAQAALAEAPVKLRAQIEARAELETKARRVLGAEAKFDGKTDAEIRRAVVEKASPGIKLEGRSDAYVEARFDMATEEGAEGRKDKAPVLQIGSSRRDDGAAPDERKARSEMIERNRTLHKPTAKADE
jgi:hypothetical protein